MGRLGVERVQASGDVASGRARETLWILAENAMARRGVGGPSIA